MKLFKITDRRIAHVVIALAVLACATVAQADPPTRAARLGYLQGQVSFAHAGDDNWVEARLNRPITIGDGLWTDDNGRAELQFGVANVRLGPYSSVQILNLDDRTIQLQLAQGRINVRARALRNGEILEIDTPNLAFTIRQPGDYRIEVDPSGDSTTVSVRQGAGEVLGDGAAFTLRTNDAVRFFGRDLRVRELYSVAPVDAFDRWSSERDRRGERSSASRYVSSDVVGVADLDQYGTWSNAETYGNVWFPREVPREWAPYRYGHWAWIDPWGWSWVDDAPWGFAPFHYGRWAQFNNRWGWVPGPINVRPVYAPALVVFLGGANFSLAVTSGPVGGGIGWFPLAPGEVYRPAYNASRDYVRNVNISNTVVNTTVINNIYNNQTNVTQVNYRNAQVANAVTAVPPAVFAQSQSVQRGMVPVSQEVLRRGEVTAVAQVAPTAMGMTGGAPSTNRKPSRETLQREVVANAPPPAPVVPAAQRVESLQRNPGRPVDRGADAPTAASPAASNVRVVNSQPAQAITGQPRGMAPPQPMVQGPSGVARTASPDAGAAMPPTSATGSPAATIAPPSLQRERGAREGNGPPSMRPGSAAQPLPPVPAGPAVQPPAPQPRSDAVPVPGRQQAPVPERAVAPQPRLDAVPVPPTPPRANVPSAPQRERGMSGPDDSPRAANPAVVPPNVAPAPAAPAPMTRQRDVAPPPQGLSRPAPVPAPVPATVPAAVPAAVPVPRPAPSAAPAQVAPPVPSAPQDGKADVQRRTRGDGKGKGNDGDGDDKKDKK